MANEEQLALLKQGVDVWSQWREKHPEIQPDLSKADLMGTNLMGADLNRANLMGADLSKANLMGARLMGADLSKANLSQIILDGAIFGGDNLARSDLSVTDLSGAYLNRADLKVADLSKANLRGAKLRGTDLTQANLTQTNLNNAYLYEANLSGTNLHGANLSGTNLCRANLSGANLFEANLSEASLGGTVFVRNDLQTTKGLATIQHRGPSSIELFSVQLPQDGSALHFLRGAGVPDEWIDFWRTTMMRPIQYHSLFMSYSSKDDILARRLHADLQANGIRCWFAPEDLKIGNKFRQRIDEAIHLQDKLLLVLSEHSIVSSWVETEVEAALEKEDRQHREVLFPIRLDDAVMQTSQAWAATLHRTRHIGDFTNWTELRAYQQAFDRLLRDLKKADEPHNQEANQ